ncbi:MAG: serine hydrolase domain-containing protein, partial [Erythrobacter sp.]
MRITLLAVSLALTGCSSVPDRVSAESTGRVALPAAVVVEFDKERVTPMAIEGVADRETGRPVGVNDPVRVASISKLVMALATLRLVEEGKVDLKADVSRYLGWEVRHPAFPDVPVTLAQILMHRAALRDDAGYVIPLGESLEEKLANPAAWYASAPPGQAPFEYANLGSPLVATVLEAASGERYDLLVERTVFAPLGIEACFNWIGCSPDQARSAVVLYRSTGEVARDDASDRPPHCTFPVAEGTACSLDGYVPGTNASVFSPQGGVRMGMMDLAKIGQVLLGAHADFLTRPADYIRVAGYEGRNREQDFFCFYGLGMQVIQTGIPGCEDVLTGDGAVYTGHAGEAYGLRSGLWVDTDAGTGFAYFVTAVP